MGKTKRGHNNKDHTKGKRRGKHKSLTFGEGGDLESQLRDLQLCTKDISGDGNCLFRALSDQYYGHDTQYAKIRGEVCEFLRENEEDYKFFVEDDQTFEYHMDCMEEDGTYGGNMELAAFARMRQVDIKVYQPGLIYVIRGVDEEEAESVLHIAYHSWEHYSSVRNIDGPFTGPPEVKMQERKPKEEEEEEEGQLDSKEKVVLTACPDTNIRKVRRLLRRYKGDPNKVIDALYEASIEEEVKEEPLKEEPVTEEAPTDASIKEASYNEEPFEEPAKEGTIKEEVAKEELAAQEPPNEEAPSSKVEPSEQKDEACAEGGESKEPEGAESTTPKKAKHKKSKKLTAQQKKQQQKERQMERRKAKAAHKLDEDKSPMATSMKELVV